MVRKFNEEAFVYLEKCLPIISDRLSFYYTEHQSVKSEYLKNVIIKEIESVEKLESQIKDLLIKNNITNSIFNPDLPYIPVIASDNCGGYKSCKKDEKTFDKKDEECKDCLKDAIEGIEQNIE